MRPPRASRRAAPRFRAAPQCRTGDTWLFQPDGDRDRATPCHPHERGPGPLPPSRSPALRAPLRAAPAPGQPARPGPPRARATRPRRARAPPLRPRARAAPPPGWRPAAPHAAQTPAPLLPRPPPPPPPPAPPPARPRAPRPARPPRRPPPARRRAAPPGRPRAPRRAGPRPRRPPRPRPGARRARPRARPLLRPPRAGGRAARRRRSRGAACASRAASRAAARRWRPGAGWPAGARRGTLSAGQAGGGSGAGRLAGSRPGLRTRCSSSKASASGAPASASGAPALTSPAPATCASRHAGIETPCPACASSKHGGALVGAGAGLLSAGVTSSPVRRSTSCLSSSFSSAICELACNRLCSTAFCCRRRCSASPASPASSGALSRCPPLSESASTKKFSMKQARRQHFLCKVSSQSKFALFCFVIDCKQCYAPCEVRTLRERVGEPPRCGPLMSRSEDAVWLMPCRACSASCRRFTRLNMPATGLRQGR